MRYLYLILLLLIVITACSKVQSGLSDEILGEWKIYSIEGLSSDSIEVYPEELPYDIITIFESEVVSLIGCNLSLGETDYSAKNDGTIVVNTLIHREPCANKWVEIVSQGLNEATAYTIESSELSIKSNNNIENTELIFKLVE